ncbi:MAG: lipid-A-disaccharide synthase [bacterium]
MPTPATLPLRILIVAGEVSGDMHAAALMRALRTEHAGPIVFRGMGGDAMRAEGAELLFHTDQTAVVGVWEVLKHFRFFARLLRTMEQELASWKPDLALTVDYPGFNMRLAKRAHARGFVTAHYICPKVWAWNPGRIPRMARDLDHLITIFPFETACFAGTGLRITFAGHPLVDSTRATWAAPEVPLPWQGAHRVALLPGSRAGEIKLLLPDMLAAAAQLEQELDGCSFIIPTASAAMRALSEAVAASSSRKPKALHFVDGLAQQVMRQAHAAAVASGTATLEASLMRCPTVLVYRVPLISARMLRWLTRRARFLGLANILAGHVVMPELLQAEVQPAAIAAHLRRYLTDPAARAQILTEMDAVNAVLGEGRAPERAAQAVLDSLPARARSS